MSSHVNLATLMLKEHFLPHFVLGRKKVSLSTRLDLIVEKERGFFPVQKLHFSFASLRAYSKVEARFAVQ